MIHYGLPYEGQSNGIPIFGSNASISLFTIEDSKTRKLLFRIIPRRTHKIKIMSRLFGSSGVASFFGIFDKFCDSIFCFGMLALHQKALGRFARDRCSSKCRTFVMGIAMKAAHTKGYNRSMHLGASIFGALVSPFLAFFRRFGLLATSQRHGEGNRKISELNLKVEFCFSIRTIDEVV